MSEAAKRRVRWLAVGLAGLFLLAGCTAVTPEETTLPRGTGKALDGEPPTATPVPAAPDTIPEEEYRIVTLLAPDAIPSIDNPQFYSVSDADQEYDLDELVLGVEFDGDARAYPIGLLARHEIVNDTVGGQPLAVTY
jgi:hypothetical protein